jgi:hypothetical protein
MSRDVINLPESSVLYKEYFTSLGDLKSSDTLTFNVLKNLDYSIIQQARVVFKITAKITDDLSTLKWDSFISQLVLTDGDEKILTYDGKLISFISDDNAILYHEPNGANKFVVYFNIPLSNIILSQVYHNSSPSNGTLKIALTRNHELVKKYGLLTTSAILQLTQAKHNYPITRNYFKYKIHEFNIVNQKTTQLLRIPFNESKFNIYEIRMAFSGTCSGHSFSDDCIDSGLSVRVGNRIVIKHTTPNTIRTKKTHDRSTYISLGPSSLIDDNLNSVSGTHSDLGVSVNLSKHKELNGVAIVFVLYTGH